MPNHRTASRSVRLPIFRNANRHNIRIRSVWVAKTGNSDRVANSNAHHHLFQIIHFAILAHRHSLRLKSQYQRFACQRRRIFHKEQRICRQLTGGNCLQFRQRISIFHECVEQNRLKRLALNRHIRPLIGLRYQREINLSVYHLLIQLLRIGSNNGHADMRIGLLKLSKRLNKELRRAGHRVVSDMQLRHHSLLGFLQLRSHSVIRIQNFVNPF